MTDDRPQNILFPLRFHGIGGDYRLLFRDHNAVLPILSIGPVHTVRHNPDQVSVPVPDFLVPSREDSYERLSESAVQFVEQAPGIEEQVICRMEIKKLHMAISRLSEDDRYLICQLYFEERTERDLAEELRLSQKGINKRKKRIINHLKKLMEEI